MSIINQRLLSLLCGKMKTSALQMDFFSSVSIHTHAARVENCSMFCINTHTHKASTLTQRESNIYGEKTARNGVFLKHRRIRGTRQVSIKLRLGYDYFSQRTQIHTECVRIFHINSCCTLRLRTLSLIPRCVWCLLHTNIPVFH